MLGYLEGEVLVSDKNKIILKTSDGVGREIFYKDVDSQHISLYISQVIKEKSIEFYGFETYELKKFFESLLSVNGVGPKSAYSLISNLGVDQLTTAIAFEDYATIKKAPGIGPKAAKQIVLDLRDKITDMNFKQMSLKAMKNDGSPHTSVYMEAISAFKELGFSESQVNPLIKKSMDQKEYQKSEDLIKEVLVQLNN